MVRQTLEFNLSYMKYPFVQEMLKLWDIFSDNEVELNADNISLHEASREVVGLMEIGLGKKVDFQYTENPTQTHSEKDDKFVLCCVSGGKDSLATVLHYLGNGYNVHLYTLKGINRGYPEEYKSAVNWANALNLPIYVDTIKMRGKKYWVEHPLKNQLIATLSIAYCLENNLPTTVSFGDYQDETDDKSNFGVNWTDNINLWEAYNDFLKGFVDARVEIPLEKELVGLEIIDRNANLLPLIQSCLMTVRDRESLRQKNQKKYGLKILPNRCGSCYKCCLEYIYFCDHNKLEYNERFYKHCLEILKKKYADYTGPFMSRKFKNLREVYDAYFEGETRSAYFDGVDNSEKNYIEVEEKKDDTTYELW